MRKNAIGAIPSPSAKNCPNPGVLEHIHEILGPVLVEACHKTGTGIDMPAQQGFKPHGTDHLQPGFQLAPVHRTGRGHHTYHIPLFQLGWPDEGTHRFRHYKSPLKGYNTGFKESYTYIKNGFCHRYHSSQNGVYPVSR